MAADDDHKKLLAGLASDLEAPGTRRDLIDGLVARIKDAGTLAIEFAHDGLLERLTPRVQRPPGALPELEFLVTCTRCGECVKACPPRAILVLGEQAGLAAGTPYLETNRRACTACPDTPCIPACPVGALKLVDIRSVEFGTAVIDRARCRPFNGRACTRCSDVCPIGEDAIIVDEDGKPYIDPSGCIGCGRCRFACPTAPRSIHIEPRPHR
jgi:MauM/NapG family ferredoxin protein